MVLVVMVSGNFSDNVSDGVSGDSIRMVLVMMALG